MDEVLKEKLTKLNPENLSAFLEREAVINPEFQERLERITDLNSPDKILSSILREIKFIGSSGEFINWRECARFSQALARINYDIETLLLPNFPEVALGALDAFLKISPSVINRSDDSSGNVSDEIRYAVNLWGKSWNLLPNFEGVNLANAIWEYFDNNDYGVYDSMISDAGDALKRKGLQELHELVKAKCADETNRFSRYHALHDIALLRQSPEDYLDAFRLTRKDMSIPDQLELAELYIDKFRLDEAIPLLEAIKSDFEECRRTDLLIRAYEINGKSEVVKQLRWDGFVKQHRNDLFQSYYASLPSDPDKKHAIDAAINVALTWDVISSISMLFKINQHAKAAELLHQRYNKLEGHLYYALIDFADEFTKQGFPLEAILIYRRLIEDILARAQSKYYHHAINYLKASKKLSIYVVDWKDYPTTGIYFEQLKGSHKRKPSFMQKFEQISCE